MWRSRWNRKKELLHFNGKYWRCLREAVITATLVTIDTYRAIHAATLMRTEQQQHVALELLLCLSTGLIGSVEIEMKLR